jgi:hypothetical protein
MRAATLAVLIAASAVAAEPFEGVKGIPWGASRADVMAKLKGCKKEKETLTCTGDTFATHPALISLAFNESGRLAFVAVKITPLLSEIEEIHVLEAMAEKYGKQKTTAFDNTGRAYKWSTPRTEVDLSATPKDGGLSLFFMFNDKGPGIAARKTQAADL